MQVLFQMDVNRDRSGDGLELFCNHMEIPPRAKPFFLRIVSGVIKHRAEIDDLINRFSAHWKIDRMSAVDRNIMRVAVYELLHCDDVPDKVSINEAVDIGKRYGTEESGAFINGILDSVRDFVKNPGPATPGMPLEEEKGTGIEAQSN